MARAWFVLLAIVAAASACDVVIGLGDYAEQVGGEAPTGGKGGVPAGCLPALPTGWAGPVVLYRGDVAAPDCTGAWELAIDGGVGVIPGCDCPCTVDATADAQEAACDTMFTVIPYGDGACGGSGGTSGGMFDVCFGLTTNPDTIEVSPTIHPPSSPVCSNPAPVLTNEFVEHFQLCRTTETLGSEALCHPSFPPGYDEQLCVYRAEAAACPEDFPVESATFFDRIETGSYGCRCTCDESALVCRSEIELFDFASCTAPAPEVLPLDGTCLNPSVSPIRGRVQFSQIAGECVGVAEVSGELTTSGTVTVCCQS